MTHEMVTISYRQATAADTVATATLVLALTEEICLRSGTKHFDIELAATVRRCEELMARGMYAAILGWYNEVAIAVATLAETHALYAGGTIGIVQEFYVAPEFRSSAVGATLLDAVREYGRGRNWACIELCTPPLPEFERTLQFYTANGLEPVGGRKMRQVLSPSDAA